MMFNSTCDWMDGGAKNLNKLSIFTLAVSVSMLVKESPMNKQKQQCKIRRHAAKGPVMAAGLVQMTLN